MTDTKPGPARRMGPPGSDLWHTMLDGAEDILRNEGHAHLTSRSSEYMAMASRIPGLRDEVIRFIEESRAIQIEAISGAISRSNASCGVPAAAIAVMPTSVGLSLNREQQLGVGLGHKETFDLLDAFLDQLDG